MVGGKFLAMDEDTKRADHGMGGVLKFMCEAINMEPHALIAFDWNVDALCGMAPLENIGGVPPAVSVIGRLGYSPFWYESDDVSFLIRVKSARIAGRVTRYRGTV
jgi:hypothetical protein